MDRSSPFDGAPAWLAEVYEEQPSYVWSDGDRPSAAYFALVATIEDAQDRGLDTTYYSLGGLRQLARESADVREQGAAMIFTRFAEDSIEGRTAPELEYQPDFAEIKDRRRADILKAAYGTGDPIAYLAERTPDNFLVERLIDALARYRQLAAGLGWSTIHAAEDTLIEPGDTDPLVPAIRARLIAEGFHAQPSGELGNRTNPDEANEAFVAALKTFQASRAMAEDGVVGPNTIEALNETPAELVRRLEVNIERARWLPQNLGERAAFVNAADYTLRLYEGGRKVYAMPVIVGDTRTQTPIFADTMESVVVNPYWNVPSSILVGEIAPKQVENPNYITDKHFEVLRGNEVVAPESVDWEAAAVGSPNFRVRQTSGDWNALGRIKFLFPNKYAVYLHDTPADGLFSQDVRTFSHGCIRIAEPVRFGAWLLGTSEADIQAMIGSGERTEMPTPNLPVYIGYFTAWAEPDGTVTFPRDIYERDALVAAQLWPDA